MFKLSMHGIEIHNFYSVFKTTGDLPSKIGSKTSWDLNVFAGA